MNVAAAAEPPVVLLTCKVTPENFEDLEKIAKDYAVTLWEVQ